MGFRRKTDDYNSKPYDQNASPQKKADEFDKQYNQNRGKAKGTIQPEVKGGAERKGKHRK